MTSDEAQLSLIQDIKAHLRLATLAEDPALVAAAADMLARVNANQPLTDASK